MVNCRNRAPPDEAFCAKHRNTRADTDRIEALNAEVARLREALKDLLEDTQHSKHHCGDEDCPVDRARDALGDEA